MKIIDFDFNKITKDFKLDYEIVMDPNDTVASGIVKHMLSTGNIISVDEGKYLERELTEHFHKKVTTQVSKGAPIEVMLTTFSPKYKVGNLTNYYIYPDMGDFLTFIHLQKVAKSIREMYPYNFRFVVIFKGDLYKNLGYWSDNEIERTFELLNKMNKEAEKITGARDSVVLHRWKDFLGENSIQFKKDLYSKATYYNECYRLGKEPYYSQIEDWKKTFSEDMMLKHSDPFFDDFFTKEVAKIRAFNNLAYREGDTVNLITQKNPNLILAQTRKGTKIFSLNLNPVFRNKSHIYLTVREGDKWDFKKWSELDSHKPVYFDGWDYPMFFEKKL